jgi:hypothetical protein
MAKDAAVQAAIRTDLGAIFVSLELSRRAWLITSLSPGGGEKMSKRSVPAGEVSGLLRRFAELRRKAAARTGRDFPMIVIQEAGLDGFWIHRVLPVRGGRICPCEQSFTALLSDVGLRGAFCVGWCLSVIYLRAPIITPF